MTDMTRLQRRLQEGFAGERHFDAATRGRYATDASIYQVMPVAVAMPEGVADVTVALAAARDSGATVLARGAGTSQNGQAINRSLVLDMSRRFNRVLEIDPAAARCAVEPGVVLDELNRQLRPHGLWFPVDVSTASRATIGGMAGNNSCGTRSLCYGTMRDNVLAIDAVTADGRLRRFGPLETPAGDEQDRALAADLLDLGARNADEIAARFPAVQRRVGGYNIDALVPAARPNNLAHLLVGSEGTLAVSTRIELKLAPLLGTRTVGACHFARFQDAMDAAQHLVRLKPIAVELIDRTMIALARSIAMFRPTVERLVRGDPDAILLVEFGEPDNAENLRRLADLHGVMADLGYGFEHGGSRFGGVVDLVEPALQAAVTDVRQSGLNIMMSMKSAGKPVSFVEDCAVPLEHLADYTARLTEVFARHGTSGTWYAHASVGCLHVRPILNLKLDKDLRAMRAIAEEAFALVRAFKGSHSGEHGDGISRSEFHEAMFGRAMVAAFEAVKDRFDPDGLLNPGRIVRPPRMDDRRLMRFGPDYRPMAARPTLDWSSWMQSGGLQGAVEMCNNNGACRSLTAHVMCPSYRVTRDERDVTRGRANTLRLALSGQLGAAGLASDEVADALTLCVSCKGCRRECPTGVDMARMKIEVKAARAAAGRLPLRDRLIAYLPRYAPFAARLPWLMNLRDRLPGLAAASETVAGFAARRPLPRWRRPYRPPAAPQGGGREVVLFADTFGTYFEPETIEAALSLLAKAGYRAHVLRPADGAARPLCCGRTFLSAGLVEEARREARRLVAALRPWLARDVAIVGLEPSCLLTLRDELGALLPGSEAEAIAGRALLLEEFIDRETAAGRFALAFRPLAGRARIHGHCHQKAFSTMGAMERALRLVPGLDVAVIASSCCGMAGAFGYQAETYEVSMKMAEQALLPAVRAADDDTIIVANGTSCRHQIAHGAGREALHIAVVLDRAAS